MKGDRPAPNGGDIEFHNVSLLTKIKGSAPY